MVSASVKIENGLNSIFDEFRQKSRSNPTLPELGAEGLRNHDCYSFVHARFYARYRAILDNLDISGMNGLSGLRKDRTDRSALRDPRKIAYETNYLISSFKFLKGFHPPLGDFVVQYSARPDLEIKCARQLEVTGMRG